MKMLLLHRTLKKHFNLDRMFYLPTYRWRKILHQKKWRFFTKFLIFFLLLRNLKVGFLFILNVFKLIIQRLYLHCLQQWIRRTIKSKWRFIEKDGRATRPPIVDFGNGRLKLIKTGFPLLLSLTFHLSPFNLI